ncbi:hypothetical protein ACLOJK_032025 [Asimina triloba]
MAVGTFSFAVPAVATAAGLYFFSNQQNKTKEIVESRIETSVRRKQGAEKKQEKKKAEIPRAAVELDGLNCFETIVSH